MLASSLGYHLDECRLVALTLVPFLKIKNLVVLTHFTYISVKLHLVKCTKRISLENRLVKRYTITYVSGNLR